jgi:DNA-binding response OmpR family regulator
MTSSSTVDVLLIEDDLSEAELAIYALGSNRARKYSVDHVIDGSAAVDYISASKSIPRLVLLDLKLPMLDGFTILTKIKQKLQWQGVPVVILSSSSIESEINECYALGASAYVIKPMDFEDYKTAINRIVLFWLETASLVSS